MRSTAHADEPPRSARVRTRGCRCDRVSLAPHAGCEHRRRTLGIVVGKSCRLGESQRSETRLGARSARPTKFLRSCLGRLLSPARWLPCAASLRHRGHRSSMPRHARRSPARVDPRVRASPRRGLCPRRSHDHLDGLAWTDRRSACAVHCRRRRGSGRRSLRRTSGGAMRCHRRCWTDKRAPLWRRSWRKMSFSRRRCSASPISSGSSACATSAFQHTSTAARSVSRIDDCADRQTTLTCARHARRRG